MSGTRDRGDTRSGGGMQSLLSRHDVTRPAAAHATVCTFICTMSTNNDKQNVTLLIITVLKFAHKYDRYY